MEARANDPGVRRRLLNKKKQGVVKKPWPACKVSVNRRLLAKLKVAVPGLVTDKDITTGFNGLTKRRPFLLGNDDRLSRPEFMRGFRGLVNLDRSDGGGTHWVRLDVLPKKISYFDPVGSLAGGWPPLSIEKLAEAADLPMYVSEKAFMKPDEHWCGHLCMSAVF